MNKEKVTERLDLLERERESVRTSLSAYDGAIQDCKFWLSQLETPPEVMVPEVTESVEESN